MNLFIARRTDCSDTPICRAISASVNLLVDVNSSVHETATQASRGSVARLMNTFNGRQDSHTLNRGRPLRSGVIGNRKSVQDPQPGGAHNRQHPNLLGHEISGQRLNRLGAWNGGSDRVLVDPEADKPEPVFGNVPASCADVLKSWTKEQLSRSEPKITAPRPLPSTALNICCFAPIGRA